MNVANAMSAKFKGRCLAVSGLSVRLMVQDPSGTVLYMPEFWGSYPNIRFEGEDIAEPYLEAFDRAGLKVTCRVEPMNADINTLIDIVMNRYKNHSSVIGFGVDLEWYKNTCGDGGCIPTVQEIASWNTKLKAIILTLSYAKTL